MLFEFDSGFNRCGQLFSETVHNWSRKCFLLFVWFNLVFFCIHFTK